MNIKFLFQKLRLFFKRIVGQKNGKFIIAENAIGSKNILVLLIKFPDVEPVVDIAELEDKYNQKLADYVKEVSYGKTTVQCSLKGWYTLPESVAEYQISEHNEDVDPDLVTALIQDAIDAADSTVDFSIYDLVFISLGAKKEDYGMMGLCGYPGMLGWASIVRFETTHRHQIVPGGVAIYCENAHVGVVFHDLAHILGGVQGDDNRRVLPCLYDHQLQGQEGDFRGYAQFYLIYLGYFEPLSCHYYKKEIGPPGMVSWSKLRSGWLDINDTYSVAQVECGQNRTIDIAPLSRPGKCIAAVKINLADNIYYLVENRQPIGADQHLPGNGILILYCNDNIVECDEGDSPAKLIDANPDIPELQGATFNINTDDSLLPQVDTFTDREYGVEIKLLEKVVDNYRVLINWIR